MRLVEITERRDVLDPYRIGHSSFVNVVLDIFELSQGEGESRVAGFVGD